MTDTILRLAVALAIGLLVGLERGWRERDQPEGSRTAGLRTFGIFGLLGGIFAALSAAMDAPIVLAAAYLGFALLFGAFQYHEATHEDTFSATGLMAGLGVFGLGALAVVGDYQVAAAAGAALTALLASREWLHAVLRKLSWVELRSAVVLAVMTVIVLPMLPNRTVDPWGGLNPWEIWFFTVLIATISFAGYIAVRMLGPRRGLLLSGLAGAVVSSTAVTVALARMARANPYPRRLAGTAALAATVSLLRVSIIVGFLAPQVAVQILPGTLAAALVMAALGGFALSQNGTTSVEQDDIRNPFELRALLAFAGFFAIVSTANAAVVGWFGEMSLLATSALSGMFDVDVAVLGAVRLSGGPIATDLIATAILIALGSNAFGRLFLAAMAGPRKFWVPLGGATLAALLAGGLAYYVMLRV
ncbi:MgtC/SapB family protein [Sinirhodobacter sp. WL0062]|uniref:MgtC/SapB family protein n=1 Tax=Rhodobacter flavimaris TaxID=2907145 RepID=A0ABS8YWZ7_9RHOB|nr:MgtC/SapB family protein [Sinirhodobacter sp. WL0062]MCE5974337.1 MgtC/SapB family protein [Sinirhodobacter sp. WL0062]